MGLFDKIFKRNDKIKIQFIDSLDGKMVFVSEMDENQLPKNFSIPTTMHIHGNDWNVEKATPENSIEFTKTKRLTLNIRKIEKINSSDILFSLPTVSNEFPAVANLTKQTAFDVNIVEDDYRQNEFLNKSVLPLIEKEFVGIKNIWENFSKESGEYTAFKECHVRKIIGSPNLKIPFEKLKAILKINSVGQVIVNGSMFLLNGFAFKTENATYFGVLNLGAVTELCVLQWNEDARNEILEINKTFNLVFVNWCKYYMIENN